MKIPGVTFKLTGENEGVWKRWRRCPTFIASLGLGHDPSFPDSSPPYRITEQQFDFVDLFAIAFLPPQYFLQLNQLQCVMRVGEVKWMNGCRDMQKHSHTNTEIPYSTAM